MGEHTAALVRRCGRDERIACSRDCRGKLRVGFHLRLHVRHEIVKRGIVDEIAAQFGEQHRFEKNTKSLAAALRIVGIDGGHSTNDESR